MLTEECPNTEFPEFHLTIGQLPLEEATISIIIEEEYVYEHILKKTATEYMA